MFYPLKYCSSFIITAWALVFLVQATKNNAHMMGKQCGCQPHYHQTIPVPFVFAPLLPMAAYLPPMMPPCTTCTGSPSNSTENTTTTAEDIPCKCLQWTPWINGDQNSTDGGDYETLGFVDHVDDGHAGRVSKNLPFPCNNPVKIECRHAVTKAPWHESGDVTVFPRSVQCRTDRGLICQDNEQADGKCQDYEVRLLCWRSCSTMKWTAWKDIDQQSGSCDCEFHGMADHPLRHYEPCPNGGSPFDIECQTTSGVSHIHAGQRKLQCEPKVGFACWNSDQSGSCKDYKVRYLCHDP